MYTYFIAPSGELNGPVDLPHVPGIGFQLPANAIVLDEPLSAASPGRVWAVIEGQPPAQIEDARGQYYRVDNGAQYTQTELGPLPEGLTCEPRPEPFYVWDGTRWAVDSAALAAHDTVNERTWRDGEIANHEWLVSRHRAEVDLQRSTTLPAERFRVLLEYLQALRDWPAAQAFPEITERPVAPSWLAELTP